MIGFFPELHNDEFGYSALLRYCRMVFGDGEVGARQLIKLGVPEWLVSLPTLVDLDEPPDGFLPFGRSTGTRIIQSSSLCPYFQAFADPARIQIAAGNRWRPGQRSSLQFGGSSTIYKSRNALRCCLDCSEIDHRTFGYIYLRRAHQLPGVEMCHIHGTVLRVLKDRLPNRSNSFDPSLLCIRYAQEAQELELDTIIAPSVLKLSQQSAALLRSPRIDLRRTQRILGAGLRERGYGWRGSDKIFDMKLLAREFSSSSLVDHFLPTGIARGTLENILRHCFCNTCTAVHPLTVLLMLDFTGVDLGELRAEQLSLFSASGNISSADPPLSCGNPFCSEFSSIVLNRPWVGLEGRFTHRCKICGFRYSWSPTRPEQRIVLGCGAIWENTLADRLRHQPRSLRSLAREFRVGVRTLQRYARKLDLWSSSWTEDCKHGPRRNMRRDLLSAQHKEVWVIWRRRNPNARTSDLSGHAKNAYRFLCKHDSVWLSLHLPFQGRPGKPQRAHN